MDPETVFKTAQAFLARFNAKDPKVQDALGLSERMAEIFFGALESVTEESGLLIVRFSATAAKLNKTASVYINNMKTRGMMKNGLNRGDWEITAKAFKRMETMLAGQPVPADDASGGAPKRKRGRPRNDETKPAGGQFKIPKRLAGMTIGDYVAELQTRKEEIAVERAALITEESIVDEKLAAFSKVF